MIEFLKHMPDTVWGAILGSSITLFGVWLSNRHQRLLQKEEREHVTKKEVFLRASEEIALAKVLLMKLPGMDASKIEEEMEVGLEISKIHIIGEDETIRAVSNLQVFLSKSLLGILPMTIPLNQLRADINILSASIDSNFQKQNQMLNEMTAFNLRGDNDSEFWGRLQGNFNYHSKQIDEAIAARTEKQVALNQAQKELMLKCLEVIVSMSELEVEALKCIRGELGLTFDVEAYRTHLALRNKEAEADFSKFLVKIPNE